MPGIKRNYGLIFRYLRKYGTGPQVLPLMKTSRDLPGDERKKLRWEKYIQHIDNLIDSGELDLKDVYQKEEEIENSIQEAKNFKATFGEED